MAKKRGRPAYKATARTRRIVEEMKFCGEAEDTIARALGISTPTLQVHFAEELANGHANRRKEVLGLLFKSARDGNVSAQKKLEEIGRAAGAAEAVNNRQPKSPAPASGKKEERQAAAGRVGGIFAPPAPPKLVVDNA